MVASFPTAHNLNPERWVDEHGDYVLRFPRPIVDLHRLPESTTNLASLALERRLLPSLSDWLTVPVPQIEIYGADGPNGLPFAGHQMLRGETVLYASRPPGPTATAIQ